MENPSGESGHWKWRIVYVNPNDPKLVVPKRNPAFGYTLNFAHPKAFVLLFLLLIPALALVSFMIFGVIR